MTKSRSASFRVAISASLAASLTVIAVACSVTSEPALDAGNVSEPDGAGDRETGEQTDATALDSTTSDDDANVHEASTESDATLMDAQPGPEDAQLGLDSNIADATSTIDANAFHAALCSRLDAAVSSSCCDDSVVPLAVGQVHTLGYTQWLPLTNTDGGDTCVAKYGGTVKVTALGTTLASVTYTAPGPTGGTACPTGAQLDVDRATLERSNCMYSTTAALTAANTAAVDAILAGTTAASVGGTKVGDHRALSAFHWVTVLKPVTSSNNSFVLGDHCSVQPGNEITVVGFDSSATWVLLRYATSSAAGAPCPNNTLFQVPVGDYATL